MNKKNAVVVSVLSFAAGALAGFALRNSEAADYNRKAPPTENKFDESAYFTEEYLTKAKEKRAKEKSAPKKQTEKKDAPQNPSKKTRGRANKLTEAEIKTLVQKAMTGENRSTLAKEFGVSTATVQNYIRKAKKRGH